MACVSTSMNYHEAQREASKGRLIRREGWNGKGMAVFQQPSCVMPVNEPEGGGLHLMGLNSFPAQAKAFIARKGVAQVEIGLIMRLVGPDGRVTQWHPSMPDLAADDWEAFDAVGE